MFVVLEHRFYGESNPAGDYSASSLKLLSSEQALADAANFRAQFNAQLEAKGARPGPWIVVGCSYSAGLAAWFRSRHADAVIGAISPSGPVNASLDQANFLGWFESAAPPACVANAKTGIAQIENLVKAGEWSTLSSAFNTCQPLSAEDEFWFLWNVALAVGTSDQFANPVPTNTLTQACDILASEGDKMAAIAKIVATSENVYAATEEGGSCVHLSQDYFVADLSRPDNPARSWFWQKMTEFGWLKSSTGSSSIFFPSFDLSVDKILAVFQKIFAVPSLVPNTEWTNANYGGFNLVADNVIFTNGLYDPWHLVSISKDIPAPSGVKAVTYEGGHCATLNAASHSDPPSLIAARAAVEAEIDSWLSQYRRSQK